MGVRGISVTRDRIKDFRRVPASELLPNPKNWRTHPKNQQSALRAVLEEVGYADALIARELPSGELMLVDGHLRAETTPSETVPVLVLDVDEDEANKLLVSLDPLAAMAGANKENLDALLRSVQTGSEDLANMLTGLGKSAGLLNGNTAIVEDEAPEPPAQPVTRPGDLWLLGEHRLLCGDSTDSSAVARLMGGSKSNICFTSPPYAQQRDYGKKITDWEGLMRGVFANVGTLLESDGQVLVNLGLVHRDGEWLPYWDGWISWMRENGWRRFGWYVWDQGFGLPGDWNGRLAPSHEFVFHFNRVSVRPQKSVDKKPGNIKARNSGKSTMRAASGELKAFTNPGASQQPTKIADSVIRINRAHGGHGINHPAIFPVAFAAAMLNSWPGLAYEPFCGSGTTIIAAEQLGRRCFGMELDPGYCDVIVERWEKLTGGKAVRGG